MKTIRLNPPDLCPEAAICLGKWLRIHLETSPAPIVQIFETSFRSRIRLFCLAITMDADILATNGNNTTSSFGNGRGVPVYLLAY